MGRLFAHSSSPPAECATTTVRHEEREASSVVRALELGNKARFVSPSLSSDAWLEEGPVRKRGRNPLSFVSRTRSKKTPARRQYRPQKSGLRTRPL